ncbi:unnamed protein product [Peronospora destructor]|uniref:SCP domain-containing protein n=1 Tax=Peronospora destructor TaxID=86335 RepID=A0AAV0UCF3_9STRA|nr:unnamed protein product [Peronospora destructor]
MIYTRVFLLPTAIVAMTLRFSPVFGIHTQVRYKWKSKCDYFGEDIKSVRGISSKCGHQCVIEAKCTHWSWTDVDGGTCWLKQSRKASILMSAGQGFCGYITDRVSIADSTQNNEQNNPAQIEQNPVQNTIPIEQNSDLVTSWTFSNKKAFETPESTPYDNGLKTAENAEMLKQNPAQIELKPIQIELKPIQIELNPSPIELKPAQIKQEPIQIKQEPAQIKLKPAQIKQEPAKIDTIPIEQKPVQKADLPTSWTFSNEKALETPESTPYDNGLKAAENAEMLSSLNSYRADNGVAALIIDNRLMAAAMVHSKYQATYCIMQHEGINDSNPGDRMKSQNYFWSYSAENVAAGQANVSEVMTSWWNSEHHRDNILRVTVTHVGFALVANDACEYKRFWTQDFGAEQTA